MCEIFGSNTVYWNRSNIQQGRIVKHLTYIQTMEYFATINVRCHSQKWKSSKICGSAKTARPKAVCLGSLSYRKGGKKYTPLTPCIWMKNLWNKWETNKMAEDVGANWIRAWVGFCLFVCFAITIWLIVYLKERYLTIVLKLLFFLALLL